MQSKLLKSFSRVFLSALILISLSHSAGAKMTITPASGGTLSSPFAEALAPTVTPTYTFYYFVGTVTPPNFASFTPLDLTVSSASDTALRNQIAVTVFSLPTPRLTGTQQAVIQFQVVGSTQPAPIASVGGVTCAGAGNNRCVALNATTNHYYGALYQGFATTIGFYMADLCADMLTLGGGVVNGCSGGTFVQPTDGTPTVLQVKFSIAQSADSNPRTVPSGAALDTMSVPMVFSFQSDSPTYRCATSTSLGEIYRPGDQSIRLLQTNPATQQSFVGLTTTSGQAPATSMIVVARDGGVPDVTSTGYTGNSVVKTVPAGVDTNVTGFVNSTPGDQHPYQMSFIMRDATGVSIPPASAADCLVAPVFAAPISGFLGGSNCFIATATFEDNDAIPVHLFRTFRDLVLLRFDLGESFVAWYYSWSPEAAEWLDAHPVFRVPVLYLLFPLEVVAWMILHPILLYFLIMGLMGAGWMIVFRRKVGASR